MTAVLRRLPLAAPGAGPLRAVIGLAFGLTLALLPFESLVFSTNVGGVALTELELATDLTLGLWLLLLIRERRMPMLPWPVLAMVCGLIVVSAASAVLAGPLAPTSTRFVARSAAFWLLFVAAADLVRTERSAVRLLGWALMGGSVSAILGWLALARGTADGLFGFGRDFTVAGTMRVAGTFDYPNTAAMAWEALLTAGLPLLAMTALRRGQRIALAVALGLIAGAMLFTLSRGAVLGAVGGLAVMVVLAAFSRERRTAIMTAGSAAALVIGMVGLQVMAALPAARLTADGEDGFYGATYQVPAEIRIAAQDRARISVTVTNTGAAAWTTEGATPFALGYHWLDTQTSAVTVLDGVRTALPSTIQPVESSTVAAQIEAPRDDGEYRLAWDLVHEDVTWFSEKGVPSGVSTVIVERASAAGQALPDGGASSGAGGTVVVWPDLVPVPGRADLWAAALDIVSERPLLGIGPGMFRLVYGDYLGLERWDERIHANQLYLELAATTGLSGLAFFLALVGAAVLPGLRNLMRRSAGPSWAIKVGLIGAIVAFLVHGLVDYFLAFGPTGVLFWSLLGMALGLGLGTSGRAEVGLTGATGRPA